MSPPAAATRASFVLANPLMDSNNFALGANKEIPLRRMVRSRRLGKGKPFGSGVPFVRCLDVSWRKQPWMRMFR